MELIARMLPNEDAFDSGRDFYLVSVSSIEKLAESIIPESKHFALFVAADFSKCEYGKVLEQAKALIGTGLASCCAWGPDCARFENIVDVARVELDLDEAEQDVIMTTQHGDKPLEKALWYFAHCAFAAGKYETDCRSWITVSVDNDDWARRIRDLIPKIIVVDDDSVSGAVE